MPDAAGLEILHDFVSSGTFPIGKVIEGSDGNLYGTTYQGGLSNIGTVFRVAKDGSGFALLKSFACDGSDGCFPFAALVEGSDGNLYGTTLDGGASNGGTVFKIARDGSGFTVLKSFVCGTDSCQPTAALIEGSDGNLYGTTEFGGASNAGTIFKLAKDGSGYTLLKSFSCDGSDGCFPFATLIEGSDGNLYGTTLQGGASAHGTIFKIDKTGSGFALLKSFACGSADGCSPLGPLVEGSDGSLYGTTFQGGSAAAGTVFKIAKDGSDFAVLKSFTCAIDDSCGSTAGLIEGSDGNLYGTNQGGGVSNEGTVFKIAKDGSGFALLKSFDCGTTDGCVPSDSLIEGSDGNLYGTNQLGGASNEGTVFKIARDGSVFTLVKYFGCDAADGCLPLAGLIEGNDGNLYGTTQHGGASDGGTVYKIAKDGSAFTLLKSFDCGSGDGCNPTAALIEGSDGDLYGTTQFDKGTVFKISKDGSVFTVLKTFACQADGCRPAPGLLEGSDGNLYGMTQLAGGAVFKLAKDGSGFAVLKNFTCGAVPGDGCFPAAALIEGSDGNLYGTTQQGGASAAGTIFKIAKDGSGFTLLKTFSGCGTLNGCLPTGGLIEGSDGNLYGTNKGGGVILNGGTVFKIAKDGSGFTVIKSFTCVDGCGPSAVLTEGSDGNLYGTTENGGLFVEGGTVFTIAKDGSGFNVLHSFFNGVNCLDGCYPVAGVILGSDGKLYGTTRDGGDFAAGVIYRFVFLPKNSQTITVMQGAPSDAEFNTTFFVEAIGGESGNPVVIATSGACSGGGNNSATITMTSGTGDCTVTFDQAGGPAFDAAPTVTQTTMAFKSTPSITWKNPADIFLGTALSSTQLNATASAIGTFEYTPAAGTVLALGNGQFLSTFFTPSAPNNFNTVEASVSINVLPPDTALTSVPAAQTKLKTASFSFTSTMSGGPFECQLDGGTFAACTSPKSYSKLAKGSHTFQVRATDGLGHPDPTPASYTWVVDATPPKTSIVSGPSNPTTSKDAELTFASTEPNSTFQCSLDNAPLDTCTSPQNHTGLSAGKHTFKVRSTDAAGNVGSPATFKWVIQ